MPDALAASALGLSVALGCGPLIGLVRERRKGEGDDGSGVGIRSFTVAALCGGRAQSLAQRPPQAAGAIMVALRAARACFKSRSRDPGLTTELALFADGGLAEHGLVRGVLLSVTANSAVRIFTPIASGAASVGLRVAFVLALELAAAWSAGLMRA